MYAVIIKTFVLIFLFFAFLFAEIECLQVISKIALDFLYLDPGAEMLSVGYNLCLQIIMFLIFGYFIYLTYAMMDSAIGIWVYKEDVAQEFDDIVERSVDWAFYKAFRIVQIPLLFFSIVLLFGFMLANFFNLICAFGGFFASVCSFFFSLILMMLGISFIVCFMMIVFNSMFLFWGDDLVLVSPNEENSDIFEMSRRFFFMKKSNMFLSLLTFLYLVAATTMIVAFDVNKLVVFGVSIPVFFLLKYLKSWFLELSFQKTELS